MALLSKVHKYFQELKAHGQGIQDIHKAIQEYVAINEDLRSQLGEIKPICSYELMPYQADFAKLKEDELAEYLTRVINESSAINKEVVALTQSSTPTLNEAHSNSEGRPNIAANDKGGVVVAKKPVHKQVMNGEASSNMVQQPQGTPISPTLHGDSVGAVAKEKQSGVVPGAWSPTPCNGGQAAQIHEEGHEVHRDSMSGSKKHKEDEGEEVHAHSLVSGPENIAVGTVATADLPPFSDFLDDGQQTLGNAAGLVSQSQSGKTFDTQYRSNHMGSSNKFQPPAVPKRPTYASKVIGVVNNSRFGKSMAGADWPPMLTSNPISKVKLHYMDPGTAKQSHKIKVPSSCAQRIEEWANCLVGYFIGNSLTYSLVCSIAHMHWHTLGLKEVKGTENGFYIFKFATLEAKDAVMEGGPWDFSGQPIILKKWNRNLILAKEKHTKVPIWVKLYNLPLEYWGKDGLSLVTSMIGNPLHPDAMTETCNRISYARVYVEIDINSELLGEFEIEVEDEAGNPSHILIKCEYQWQPMKCMECKCFGHDCSQPTPSAKTKVPAPRNTKGPQRMEWQPVRNKNPRINESLTKGDKVNKGKEKVMDTNHKSDSNVFEVLNSIDTEEQPAFDVQCTPQSQHKAENLRKNTPDQIHVEECSDSSLYSSHDELDDLIDEDAPSSSRKGGSNSKKKKKNKKNKRRR